MANKTKTVEARAPQQQASPFTYLSDELLDRALTELAITLSDLRFRAEREPFNGALRAELLTVNRYWLTAKAERTARLALTPEMRAEIAKMLP